MHDARPVQSTTCNTENNLGERSDRPYDVQIDRICVDLDWLAACSESERPRTETRKGHTNMNTNFESLDLDVLGAVTGGAHEPGRFMNTALRARNATQSGKD